MVKRELHGNEIIYLGGRSAEKTGACLVMNKGEVKEVSAIFSVQEEADDRLTFHINFAVGNNGAKKVSIITNDTDIFVCLIHYVEM